MDLIVKFSLVIAALTLIGCGSSEIRGERLEQLDIVDSKSWTEINVVFQQPDRFIRGRTEVNAEVGEGLNVLYPAANEAMFLGAVLGHAIVGTALLDAEQRESRVQADNVLDGTEPIFDGINSQAATKRLAEALHLEMGITANFGHSDRADIPTLQTEPYFALAQSKHHVVLENLVVISMNGSEAYTNRISLISRQFDQSTLDSLAEESSLADQLLHLYTLTNIVALDDAAQQLDGPDHNSAETWRITLSDGVEYQRATFVTEREGFSVLRKLGGNLMLVPVTLLSRG